MVGARILALLDGPDSYPGPDKVEQAKDAIVKSLCELCQYAKDKATDYTLYISLENFDQRDREALAARPHRARPRSSSAASRRQHQNIGLTVDLSHLPLLCTRRPRRR